MCGGINLSQCLPQAGAAGDGRLAALRPALLYNLGRVVSYTAVGFAVGALGSALTFGTAFQGVLKLIAGIFMVLMGVNMLGIFPVLRGLTPRMPRGLAHKIDAEKGKSNSPLAVGLLNGFMPCGPLQAMQLYALSTGSAYVGAFSMFLFSAGTVPLMFGLGALSSVLSKKFTRKAMTVGAVLVVVLGMSMFSQGWGLSGFELPGGAAGRPDVSAADQTQIVDGVQLVNSTLSSGEYPTITVWAGTPVRWIIDAPKGSINGCNNRMFINEYGIEHAFALGENVIEFTPTDVKAVRYTCWMGMISGVIHVVAPGETADGASAETNPDAGDAFDGAIPREAAEPTPAGVSIPTTDVALATPMSGEYDGAVFAYRQVRITLTDDGFSPAIIVVAADVETEWIIDNQSSRDGNFELLVPFYNTLVPLDAGDNPLGLLPTDSFEFSNGDGTAYGYVKVVDDIAEVDADAVRAEAAAVETLIYPAEWFKAGAKCH
jgi:sulfite exporter TauE/SafE